MKESHGIKKDVILDKGDVIKKDGVPVKLKQSATAMTTMKNEKHLKLKELLKKKIKKLKEKRDASGINQLKEKLGLKEAVGAYSFDNVKRDKEGFYNKIEMMGHQWAKEGVDAIERLCNKYGQTQFQKYIIANAFDFTRPGDDWHYFSRISKKYLSQVQYILKNSASQTPFQLLMWLEHHGGMLKTELSWALEWAAYRRNKEQYKRAYIQGFGYMGMRPEESEKRMEKYIEKIVAKYVVQPELVNENITRTPKTLVEVSSEGNLLMQKDGDMWDKLNVEDGDKLRKTWRWKPYVQMVKRYVGNRKISKKIYAELEYENHHSLLQALEELGLVEK